jgi:membrane-associated phospholipid phosphatase
MVVYLLYMQSQMGDLTLFFKGVRAEGPLLKQVMKVFTDLGNPLFYAVYLGIFLYGWRTKNRALMRFALTYAVVQLLISFALVRVLKITLGCPRPGVEGGCLPFSFDAAHNAVPSGHSTEIAGAILPLAMRQGSVLLSLGLGLLLAVVAYSRIHLGWHGPVDVAFGLMFGGYAAWLIHVYGR